MIALNKLIVATLRADAELKTLMGITPKDPRVYEYYNGDALIDTTQGKSAYITYAKTAVPERIAAVGQPVYSLAIWAASQSIAEQVAARIVGDPPVVLGLLNYEGSTEATLTASNGRQYQPVVVGSHWAAQENTKFGGINLQIRFGHAHV